MGAILLAAGFGSAALIQNGYASTEPPPAAQTLVATGSPIAVTVEEIEEIIDLIDELIETLSEGASTVAGAAGPLPEVPRLSLAADLDSAESVLEALLAPNGVGNLSASGSIDSSVAPVTLAEYADSCVELAEAALAEAYEGLDLDPEVIGAKLKTIEHLLNRNSPHNYRTKAGIN